MITCILANLLLNELKRITRSVKDQGIRREDKYGCGSCTKFWRRAVFTLRPLTTMDESATGFTLSIGAQPNRSPFETAFLTNFRAIYTNITNLTNQIKKKPMQIAQIILAFVGVVPRSPSLPLVATGHACLLCPSRAGM